MTRTSQTAIPCRYLRGGASKRPFVKWSNPPAPAVAFALEVAKVQPYGEKGLSHVLLWRQT